MAELPDYDEFDSGLLVLPIAGKRYTIPAVGCSTGALLLRAIEGDEAAFAVLNEGDVMYRRVLGAAYEQMLADDVPAPAVDRALAAALADFRHGRVAAEVAWRTGQDPKALALVMEASAAILSTR